MTFSRFLFALTSGLVLLTACDSKSSVTEAPTAEASGEATAASGDPAGCVCIWDKPPVWSETDAASRKYVTAVNKSEVVTCGEAKTVTESGKEVSYTPVKLQDGKEGWIRSEFVVPDSRVAAITERVEVYTRPDLIALTNKAFEPLDVVAIKETKGDWLHVVGKRKEGSWMEDVWIKNKGISQESKDIATAVFASRALALKTEPEQQAALRKILDNSDLSGSKLYTYVMSLVPVEGGPATDEVPADTPADTTAGQ